MCLFVCCSPRAPNCQFIIFSPNKVLKSWILLFKESCEWVTSRSFGNQERERLTNQEKEWLTKKLNEFSETQHLPSFTNLPFLCLFPMLSSTLAMRFHHNIKRGRFKWNNKRNHSAETLARFFQQKLLPAKNKTKSKTERGTSAERERDFFPKLK